MRIIACTLSLSIAFSALAYSIAIYNIEGAKQEGFMMKACMDAGGEWLRYWNNQTYCKRTNAPR